MIKHAGPTTASVSVDYRAAEMTVAVADAGPLDPGGTARPGAAAELPASGSGRGLLGLRERVALYGGELSAGPTAAGGWLVLARLPVDPPAVPAEAGSPPVSAAGRAPGHRT